MNRYTNQNVGQKQNEIDGSELQSKPNWITFLVVEWIAENSMLALYRRNIYCSSITNHPIGNVHSMVFFTIAQPLKIHRAEIIHAFFNGCVCVDPDDVAMRHTRTSPWTLSHALSHFIVASYWLLLACDAPNRHIYGFMTKIKRHIQSKQAAEDRSQTTKFNADRTERSPMRKHVRTTAKPNRWCSLWPWFGMLSVKIKY